MVTLFMGHSIYVQIINVHKKPFNYNDPWRGLLAILFFIYNEDGKNLFTSIKY